MIVQNVDKNANQKDPNEIAKPMIEFERGLKIEMVNENK